MNNVLNIPYHCFYCLYLFSGRNSLIECCRKATGNYLLLVLKGLSFLATRSQSMDASFQIQEKNNPLEILLICFLAPLSNDLFCASVIRLQLVRRWRKKIILTLFRVWFYRSLCVFISFNFQIASICLIPMTCEGLEY